MSSNTATTATPVQSADLSRADAIAGNGQQDAAEPIEFAVGFSNSRMLWLFASLIIVCIIVFAYGFYRQFERSSLQAIELELGNLAALLSDHQAEEVRGARGLLTAAADELGTKLGTPAGPAKVDEQIAGMLKDILPGTSPLRFVALLDGDGRLKALRRKDAKSTLPLAQGELDRLYREYSQSGPRSHAPRRMADDDRPVLPLSTPVRDRSNRVVGVLIAGLALDRQNYGDLALGQEGRISVYSTEGFSIITYPPVPSLPRTSFADHPTFVKIADGAPSFSRNPSILMNRDVYMAARGVPGTALLLIVSRNAGEARAGLMTQAAYIGAVTLGLSIAILLFTGMFARQLHHREEAEAQLAESRRNLLTAQRVARLGSWSLDIGSGKIVFSEQARDILELRGPLELPTGTAALTGLIHPEDREQVNSAFRRVLEGQVVEGEYRVQTASGRIRWLRTRTEAQLNAGQRADTAHGTIQDITLIKEAQLRLAESEREYRVLSDNMRDLVSLHELDGTLRFASNSFKRITGYAPIDIVGLNFYHWVHPDDVSALQTEFERQLRVGRVELHAEFRYRHHAGHYLWLECLAASVHDRDGHIAHIQASSRDVTERRRALTALRESEERFRRIIEFTSDLYWETDSEYRFTQLSMGAQKYLGIVPRSIGTRRWENPFYHAPADVWSAHKADIAARRPFKDLVITMVDPDKGRMLEYTSISGEPFYDDDGKFRGYRGIGRFITQQKKYELDLAERTRQLSEVNAELSKEASRRRELERRLLLAIEKELAQVGLELHDELGQNLTGTALLAKTLQKKLAEKGVPEAADAARVHALVNETIRQTRLISHGLSPHIMGPEGLIEALQQLADDVNSLGMIDCRFECDGEPRIADTLIARGLYRIAQEAVNNALKHSHAKNIMIELTALGGETRLAVIDNGIGIRAHDAEPLSDSALHSIKYRSGVMGASLSVSRRPGGGTEIAVALPVDADAIAPARTWENG
ncbi:MAG: PAS domain S-box protein [Burkholderiales bacterium]|nr:PAS domain S-box protein [Burkholderiales bacterium]